MRVGSGLWPPEVDGYFWIDLETARTKLGRRETSPFGSVDFRGIRRPETLDACAWSGDNSHGLALSDWGMSASSPYEWHSQKLNDRHSRWQLVRLWRNRDQELAHTPADF